MTRNRVLVLSGRGRYADPWHDHAATSHEVALVLAGLVDEVEVRSSFPTALDDVDDFALVVVNCGRGRTDAAYDGDDDAWAGHHASLHRYAMGGGPVLGLHQSANTFADSPHWSEILGARWVPGVSGHPPFGESVFEVTQAHPVTDGMESVTALDERYCDVEQAAGSTTLLTHVEDGRRHPAAWSRDDGRRRSAYDALGHDTESYRSSSRRLLLRREVTWLLGEPNG